MFFSFVYLTDPPYGMGMDHWDHSVPDVNIWREVYSSTKKGILISVHFAQVLFVLRSVHLNYIIAWHANVEDAGFVIKDQIMWMTTTKMAKYNMIETSNAHEPIVVGQKPYNSGSLKDNHEKWKLVLHIDRYRQYSTLQEWEKEPLKGWQRIKTSHMVGHAWDLNNRRSKRLIHHK